jgi:putative oxidoreductase
MKMLSHKPDKHRDTGLLILRVGIGVMFMCHGYPKIAGGPEVWARVGGAMSALGVNFGHAAMGLVAGLSECGGGLLLVLGLFTRPACFFMLSTMIVATVMHLRGGDPFVKYSHALEAGILFFSLLLIGPGKFSLDDNLS